jgi:hypothetical protein
MILSYLDIRDLDRCERVDQGWGQFFHEWMALSASTSTFRNLPKSTASTIYSTEERVMLFKKCGKD